MSRGKVVAMRRPGNRGVLAALALAIAAALVSVAGGGASGPGARGGVVLPPDLPGPGWTRVVRDDQLGLITKALSASHPACPASQSPSVSPTDVGIGLFARPGDGLSTSLSFALGF